MTFFTKSLGNQKSRHYKAANFGKVKHLEKALQFYLLKNKLTQSKLSLDIVSIMLNNKWQIAKLDFYENITL